MADSNDSIIIKLGSAGQITVDTHAFMDNVRDYIYSYGLKQILNDCHASEKDPAAKMALVEKKLKALYAGEVRTNSGREVDPVRKEAKRMAKARFAAYTSTQLRELGERYKTDDAVMEALITHFLPQAKAHVDALAAVPFDF